MNVRALVRRELGLQRGRMLAAGLLAGVFSLAAVSLLGLSGWRLAEAARPLAAPAFAGLPAAAAILIVVLALVRPLARYGERIFGHEAALTALARLRPCLFASLAAAPAGRSLAVASGEAAGRLVQDVDAVEMVFAQRSAIWGAVAAAVAAGGLIALASPAAAVAFLALLGLQLALAALIARRASARPAAAVLSASSGLKAAIAAGVSSARDLRCLGLTTAALDAVLDQEDGLLTARADLWSAEGLGAAVSTAVAGVAVATVFALAWPAGAGLAILAAFAAAAGMEGATGLSRAFDRRGAFEAAVARLDEWTAPDRRARPAPVVSLSAEIAIAGPGGWTTLAPGDRVALVGPSGSGKTRLLSGLVGLWESAWVRVGGRPLAATTARATRALFALAAQDAPLLSGTVRENLCMGRALADEALWQALDDAALDDLVRALPQGLDTWVGDGGRPISGGERKRLSLARAYLKPAPWLLLDEPTEGLDPATEHRVVEGLARRLERTGQGALIASHRPAPLALCSTVISLAEPDVSVAA